MIPRKLGKQEVIGFVVYDDGVLPFSSAGERQELLALADLYHKARSLGVLVSRGGMPQLVGRHAQAFKESTGKVAEEVVDVVSSHFLRNIHLSNDLLGEQNIVKILASYKEPFVIEHQRAA